MCVCMLFVFLLYSNRFLLSLQPSFSTVECHISWARLFDGWLLRLLFYFLLFSLCMTLYFTWIQLLNNMNKFYRNIANRIIIMWQKKTDSKNKPKANQTVESMNMNSVNILNSIDTHTQRQFNYFFSFFFLLFSFTNCNK